MRTFELFSMIPIEIVEMGHGVWWYNCILGFYNANRTVEKDNDLTKERTKQTPTKHPLHTKNTSKRTQLFPHPS